MDKEKIKDAFKVFGPVGAVGGFISDVLSPLAPIIDWITIAMFCLTLALILLTILNRKGIKLGSIHNYLPHALILTILFGVFSLLGLKTQNGFFGDNFDSINRLQASMFNIEQGVQRIEKKIENVQVGIDEIKEIVSGDAEIKNMTSSEDLAATKKLNERTKNVDAKRIAIIYFDNSGGDANLNKLKKGLADMMITDLSSINMLDVVERGRLEEILAEQKLNNSDKFDPSTASRIGKLLGAEIILTGGYFEMLGNLRIDARFIDVETGRILKSDGVDGATSSFFKIQKQLSWKIIRNLDAKLSDSEKQSLEKQENSKNVSLDDTLLFSEALDLLDKKEFTKSKKILDNLVAKYPDFEAAQNALRKHVIFQ